MSNYSLPVNYSAILGNLSYGLVGRNLLKQLDNLGLNISLFPIGHIDVPQEEYTLVNKCLHNSDTYNRRATSLRIQQQFDLAHHIGKGKHLAFPIFELNRFTQRELTHLRAQDGLIVASQWAKDILVENKVLNDLDIHVVPLGVDRKIFHEKKQNIFSTDAVGPTRFINVSKWELRKGHYELLDYFESAFSPSDNVELWMVTGSLILEQRAPQEVKKWKDMYRNSPMASKIKIVDWLPRQSDVADFLRQSDCYISLSKAEGFGLGALEAMSCGLSVIITDCTAHKEFCNSTNSMLLPVGDLELAVDNVFFNGSSEGQWHSLTDLTKLVCVQGMKDTHTKKQLKGHLFNAGGLKTAEAFSWENSARKLSEIL